MLNPFDNQVLSALDFDLTTLSNGYKYTVYDGKATLIEGHKGVKTFQPEKVVFYLKKNTIEVNGSDLYIKQMTVNFALVVGNISSVMVVAL